MENINVETKKLNIDLADYWMIIRKRFLLVVFIFICIATGTFFYTKRIPPKYQSTTKIKLSLRQPSATIHGGIISLFANKGNEISSEIKIIKNKTSIHDAVVKILQKGKDSKIYKEHLNFFRSATDKENKNMIMKKFLLNDINEKIKNNSPKNEYYKIKSEIAKLTPGAIGGMIDIDQISQTNIVEIKTTGSNPYITELVSNALCLAYNIDYWESKTTEAEERLDFINKLMKNAEGEQQKNTKEVIETTEKEIFLGSAEIYKKELTNMKIELQKLKEKYKPKHPRIIKLEKLIDNLEKQLAKIPQAKQKVEVIKSESDSGEKYLYSLEEMKLNANVDYQAKKSQAQEEIQIIACAGKGAQISPNFPMNMTVGVIFGIIIGCLVAFIWEGLDTSIGKIEDVERITGLPVIAHIPLIGEKGNQRSFLRPIKIIFKFIFKTLLFFLPIREREAPLDLDKKVLFNFDYMSITSEAYRTLRTNLKFALGAGKETGNIISLTSTSPREGKTLTSTNLAISLAQMGKTTLLLEADMRCPRIAGLFKIEEKPGLSDILIGTAKRDSAIRTITDILIGDSEWDKLMDMQGLDNLNILPCGTIPPNPTELLISPEFNELISKLKEQYDYIIVDTPPSLPVSDASIVGTIVDGTLMIYQSDQTSRHLLLRAIQSLKKSNGKLLGIIINQLSFDVVIRSKSQYGYGYGYGYRDESSNEDSGNF